LKLLKRTYSLPPDTLAAFEARIAPGRRSALIAELVESWIKEREREALRQNIEEGLREMWDVYEETARDWEPLEAEVDRLLAE
jgi:hypothetical protein